MKTELEDTRVQESNENADGIQPMTQQKCGELNNNLLS